MGRDARGRRPVALAMTSLRLGPGREFDLIRQILEQDARIRIASRVTGRPSPGGRVLSGPGGDCAVIAGRTIAISVDASVEDVHFRRAWITPQQIGYRAAAAALSDLAAVAASPIGLLVTLAVPASDVPDFALAIMAGVSEAADAAGASLLGGDVSRSTGPALIDVTVTGEPHGEITRGGATYGDELWVTGTLGASAVAVREWMAGIEPSPEAVQAFTRPVPRIAEARWLAGRGVITAAIDLSDGLAGDARHLAAASAVRILLEAETIPIAAVVRTAARDDAGALALAIGGGEDHELCFAAPPDAVARLVPEFEKTFGVRLSRVGRVVEGEGVAIIGSDGIEQKLDVVGYNHFANE